MFYKLLYDFKIGDLVILLETVEWDDLVGVKGEICIVDKIYDPKNEENFFDFRICAADGVVLDVWGSEIKKLEDVETS